MSHNYHCPQCRELNETDDIAVCEDCGKRRDDYDDYEDDPYNENIIHAIF